MDEVKVMEENKLYLRSLSSHEVVIVVCSKGKGIQPMFLLN